MIDDWVKKWLSKANNDLKTARNLMSFPEEERVTEAICFHCQQASEKFLKAFLVTKNIEFGRTHILEALLDLCRGVDSDFFNISTGKLTDYAVEVRYPEVFYTPTQSEAEESVILAERISDFVLAKLKVKPVDLQMN